MNPQDNDGDRIIARMSAIRAASHHHVEELHHEATRLVDWREYVRARPTLAIAAAAGVGFMLTVGWRKKTTQVIVERSAPAIRPRRTGFRAGALSLVGSLAGSMLRQYAMRQLHGLMQQPEQVRPPEPSHSRL